MIHPQTLLRELGTHTLRTGDDGDGKTRYRVAGGKELTADEFEALRPFLKEVMPGYWKVDPDKERDVFDRGI